MAASRESASRKPKTGAASRQSCPGGSAPRAWNRADIMQREGNYPPAARLPREHSRPEFAGEVESLGGAVCTWEIGDRVFGITAEAARRNLSSCRRVTSRAFQRSLAGTTPRRSPEVFITAHDALFTSAQLQMGERVLVHAAASGVGTAAVQLAHAAGPWSMATSRSADKLEQVRALGLDETITVSDLAATVCRTRAQPTANAGVDVILDLVGGAYFPAYPGARHARTPHLRRDNRRP